MRAWIAGCVLFVSVLCVRPSVAEEAPVSPPAPSPSKCAEKVELGDKDQKVTVFPGHRVALESDEQLTLNRVACSGKQLEKPTHWDDTAKSVDGKFVREVELLEGCNLIEYEHAGVKKTLELTASGDCQISKTNTGDYPVKVDQTIAFAEPLKCKLDGKDVELPKGSYTFKSAEYAQGKILQCTPGPRFTIAIKGAALSPTPEPAPAAKTNACLSSIFDVKPPPDHCGNTKDGKLILCVNGNAEVIGHQPELKEGTSLQVHLIGGSNLQDHVKLSVEFQRIVLVGDPLKLDAENKREAAELTVLYSQDVTLASRGKLTIKVDHEEEAVEGDNCTLKGATETLELDVGGHYHFSVGLMVSYTRLLERSFARQTEDDGVTRIAQTDSPGIDYVLNVSAYPFGVDEDNHFAAIGFLLGTSVSSPIKRWYGGVELSSPIGFGISSGVVVNVVPTLDEPFLPGQPFDGDTVPTHDAAAVSWYVGANLQSELFEKVFGGLFSNGEEEK